MKLSDKISKWEKEKIISAFQAQAILDLRLAKLIGLEISDWA